MTQARRTTDALLQLLGALRYTTDMSPRLNQNTMTGTDMMCTVESSTATCHTMVPRDMNITWRWMTMTTITMRRRHRPRDVRLLRNLRQLVTPIMTILHRLLEDLLPEKQ